MSENADDDLTVILVGNKADLISERIISLNEGSKFAKKYKFDYVEVSAKTGTNINIMFEILCKSMIKKSEYLEIKKSKRKGERSYNLNQSKTYVEYKDNEKPCCGN